jgi:hypothetical protein
MAAGARLRGYSGPVAAAIGLHAIALAFLAWKLGPEPRLAPAPVMNIELTPRRPASPHDRPKPAPRRPAVAKAPPHGPQLHEPPEAPTPAPIPPGAPAEGGKGAAIRPILRNLLGCRNSGLAGLTAEERQRCAEQLAHGRGEAPGRLDLDPRGGFAADPEPYLARKPKNGCKTRAAGDVGVMGQQGAAAGVACAWAF